MKAAYLPPKTGWLQGHQYQAAIAHLQVGIADLEEQKHLSREAERLLNKTKRAFERFQYSHALEDALRCARIRG
jgi:hypothetical protein